MNILSPIDSVSEVDKLIAQGANELYCGIMSKEWKNKYTSIGAVNRREWAGCNLSSLKELEEITSKAHKHNVPVFLTLNSAFYTDEQIPLIMQTVNKALRFEIDGFIVTDIGLIQKLKEFKKQKNFEIHLSSGATVFNSKSVEFYKKVGVDRVILPRHMTIQEIKELTVKSKESYNKVDLEVFIFNDGCTNIDGFCNTLHGIGGDYNKAQLYCESPSTFQVESTKNQINPRMIRTIKSRFANKEHYLQMDCGACALYDFKKAGIKSVKIVGRGKPTTKKIKDVSFFAQLMEFLHNTNFKEDFQKKAKQLHYNFYNEKCSYGKCYYPDYMPPA